jgi:hypothetical protein
MNMRTAEEFYEEYKNIIKDKETLKKFLVYVMDESMTYGLELGKSLNEKTLRDEFAMAALTGLIASPKAKLPQEIECLAPLAYSLADAMLKERNKGE